MNSNPFTDGPTPLTHGIPLPLSIRKRENMPTPPEMPQMAQPSSKPLPPHVAASQNQPRQQFHLSPAPHRLDKKDETSVGGNTARGRTPYRPTSPTYVSQSPSTDAAKPQKRSRSPVKKLLGLGKSTSLRNIASEPRSKSSSESPEKGRTTPLRTWGNRFRHGFLV